MRSHALGRRVPVARRGRWQMRRGRRIVIGAALVLVLTAVATPLLRDRIGPDLVRVVAAGNMACDPDDPQFRARLAGAGDQCRQLDASSVAVSLRPDVVLGLGDYQFEQPTADAYRDVYGPSWGRLRRVTVPVFGNQEYMSRDGQTFLDYFGDRVRDPRGYWSQDIGDWHLVVLNSNCASVDGGGCGAGSAQQVWLDTDLIRNRRPCVLAAWHHPRWSSGIAGPDDRTVALFQTLYDHQVPLLLSGHDADFERFGPLDPAGRADPKGVRQFVVGTGGQAHYQPAPADVPWRNRARPPRDAFVDFAHHGVLTLELRPGGWTWRFSALGRVGASPATTVIDQGSGRCR